MSTNLNVKKMSTVQDRVVLALIFIIATALRGFSFTNLTPLEKLLNNKILSIIWVIIFFGSALIYGIRRSLKNGLKPNAFFNQHQWWIISLFFIAYVIMMSSVSILRHLAFDTYAFDLAIFDQAIWATLKGKFLFSSIKDNICLLGDHMSPVLLFFVPFYALWSDVRVLLVLQALITAASFFPLAKLVEDKFGKGLIPILFVFAMFLYQPLRHSVRSEFHPELVANPVAILAFYFMIHERWKSFFLCLIGLALCKENMYGLTFILGFFLTTQRKYKIGISVMVISVVFFLLTTKLFVPYFSAGKYFYQANYRYLFSGDWGASPPLFVKPIELLEYLMKIYFPAGFLSLFSPLTLILTFPILFQNVLSRNQMMHSTAFHYTSGLTPFVFISAIYGFKTLVDMKNGKYRRQMTIFSVAVILLGTIILAERPERHYFYKYRTKIDAHAEMVRNTLKQIPESFSVVANQNLVPHLSHRFQVRQFEDFQRMPQTDTYPLDSDLVIIDQRWTEGSIEDAVKKISISGYRAVNQREGFFIFAKSTSDETMAQSLEETINEPSA